MYKLLMGFAQRMVLIGIIVTVSWLVYSEVFVSGLSKLLNKKQTSNVSQFIAKSSGNPSGIGQGFIDPATLKHEQEEKIKLEQFQADQQAIRKEAKFKAFYKKPEECFGNMTKNMKNGCVHAYIEAKAKFETLYRDGKL